MWNMGSHGLENIVFWMQWSQFFVHVATRNISMRTGTAPTLVWKILHDNSLYLYHLRKIQILYDRDHASQVQYCEWLQPRLKELPNVRLTVHVAVFSTYGFLTVWSSRSAWSSTLTGWVSTVFIICLDGKLENYLLAQRFIERPITVTGHHMNFP